MSATKSYRVRWWGVPFLIPALLAVAVTVVATLAGMALAACVCALRRAEPKQ